MANVRPASPMTLVLAVVHAAVALPRRRRLAERLADARRAHPAVAVPLGPAVAQADAVDHAVAGEPVVRRRVDRPDRVRPVAQVAPVELDRAARPIDRQVERRDLLVERARTGRSATCSSSRSSVGRLLDGHRASSVCRRPRCMTLLFITT